MEERRLGQPLHKSVLATHRLRRPSTVTFDTLLKQGAEVFLVSHQSGILKDTPGLNEIRSMESFRTLTMLTQAGRLISPTIDCFTRPGAVQMVHEFTAQLEADCHRIREMERNEELFLV
jgi:hypothetical protein